MALTRNMTLNEIVGFLDNELLPQVSTEIGNWIKPRKKQGGYFVTVRQILCIVDFLGATYSGYTLRERKRDRRDKRIRIATSDKAKNFILSFFEPKQTYQSVAVSQLYEMYRHGLVHLYQPKLLKLGTRKVLKWFFYKGKRHQNKITVDSNQGKVVFKNIDHLKIVCDVLNSKTCHLPVCIDALFEDFENAVQKYRDTLRKTKYLQTNWRTTVNAICMPR